MQAMFLWDAGGEMDLPAAEQIFADASDDLELRRSAMDAARGAWEARQTSDPWVGRLAPQWPIHRQPRVDRNLIRLAIWELTYTDTPQKVVLDEAIELAKHFSTADSPGFINGVLDAVLREHRALSSEASVRESSTTPVPLSEPVDPPTGI